MALAAYLDDEYVEMRIVTEFGERITIVYDRDSIFAVMRHIEQIARDCPEILAWRRSITTGPRARINLA
jgi:hypothetical protein